MVFTIKAGDKFRCVYQIVTKGNSDRGNFKFSLIILIGHIHKEEIDIFYGLLFSHMYISKNDLVSLGIIFPYLKWIN